MAMNGLSLDGATKLQAALDTYVKGLSMGGLGWNSSAYYGKNTKVAKLCDDIIHYTYNLGNTGRTSLKKYQDELTQVISAYKGFDNSGSSTLAKVIPGKKS